MGSNTPRVTDTSSACVPAVPGRKPDPAWKSVEINDLGEVWCNLCPVKISSQGKTHVERVRHHLAKNCTGTKKASKITDTYAMKLKPGANKAFQAQLAWWVYTTGMAFYKVEHHTLLEALQLLNPGVTVPSPDQLSNSLLEKAYEKSLQQVTSMLQGSVATLVTDAWTDIRGMSVINYVAVSGRTTCFLESVYSGGASHDTEYLTGDIQRVFAKYDTLVWGGAVTDNTATNQAMWKRLQVDSPHQFFHGCVCHALHLLVKDIVTKLKWLFALQDSCKTLVKFFKKNQMLWFELNQQLAAQGLRTLVLPGATRWGSLRDCLNSVLKAESILHTTVTARLFLDGKSKTKKQKAKRRVVFDFVTSADFESRLERGVQLLEPIIKHLRRFERNETPVSEVYAMFLGLADQLEENGVTGADLRAVKKLINDRFNFAYGDAHGVGYVLDPRFVGRDMDVATRGAVEDFVAKWHGEDKADAVLLELTKFQRFVVDYQRTMPRQWDLVMKRKTKVFDFWCGLAQFPLLQTIADHVFRIATSSAAAERNFSTHAYIHSKLRNRLTPDRVEKLVHIFFNAKNIKDEDLARYSDLEQLLRGDSESESEDNNQDAEFEYY